MKTQTTVVATRFSDHDVVIVAIPNSQDIRSHAVATTGIQKPLHSLLELQREERKVQMCETATQQKHCPLYMSCKNTVLCCTTYKHSKT